MSRRKNNFLCLGEQKLLFAAEPDNRPVIYIYMFYIPIHTMLVVKFVVGLGGKRVLHYLSSRVRIGEIMRFDTRCVPPLPRAISSF